MSYLTKTETSLVIWLNIVTIVARNVHLCPHTHAQRRPRHSSIALSMMVWSMPCQTCRKRCFSWQHLFRQTCLRRQPVKCVSSFATWQHRFDVDSNFLSYPAPLSNFAQNVISSTVGGTVVVIISATFHGNPFSVHAKRNKTSGQSNLIKSASSGAFPG